MSVAVIRVMSAKVSALFAFGLAALFACVTLSQAQTTTPPPRLQRSSNF